MNIKSLSPGQSFTAEFTYGTVYVAERVRSDKSLTVVEYRIDREDAKPMRGMFHKPSLTSVTVI